jgi:nucleotide-binding universal stress UspA family protein
MYKKILVPTDGSKLSAKAIKQAVGFAQATGAKLTVLHVMPGFRMFASGGFAPPDSMLAPVKKKFEQEARAASQKLVDKACSVAAAAGVECTGAVATGDSPYEAIIRQAAKSGCDLIMMASHGRRGLQSLLLGSETQKILTHSDIPVLVVR